MHQKYVYFSIIIILLASIGFGLAQAQIQLITNAFTKISDGITTSTASGEDTIYIVGGGATKVQLSGKTFTISTTDNVNDLIASCNDVNACTIIADKTICGSNQWLGGDGSCHYDKIGVSLAPTTPDVDSSGYPYSPSIWIKNTGGDDFLRFQTGDTDDTRKFAVGYDGNIIIYTGGLAVATSSLLDGYKLNVDGSGNLTGNLTVGGDIETTAGIYKYQGISGTTTATACSPNQFLSGLKISGGIVTAAGSCVTSTLPSYTGLDPISVSGTTISLKYNPADFSITTNDQGRLQLHPDRFKGWDTNASDDLTTSTDFGGDVSGKYTNLQLGTGVVGSNELASSGVTAGTYGSATQISQFTVDEDGRITSASNITITFPSQLWSTSSTPGGKEILHPNPDFDYSSSSLVIRKDNSNVGIGTDKPDVPLHVKKDQTGFTDIRVENLQTEGSNNQARFVAKSATGTTTLFINQNGDAGVWNITNAELSFGTNNTKRLKIDKYGNVEILSNGNLTVGGDLIVKNKTSCDFLKTTDTGKLECTSAPETYWKSCTDGICYVDGNVGIGTRDPKAKLDVQNGNIRLWGNIGVGGTEFSNTRLQVYQGGIGQTALRLTEIPANGDVRLALTAFTAGFPTSYIRQTASGYHLILDSYSGKVGVATGVITPANTLSVGGSASIGTLYTDKSAPTDGMIIQGNVGIGTTTPQAKLDVNGGIRISDFKTRTATTTGFACTDINESITGLTCDSDHRGEIRIIYNEKCQRDSLCYCGKYDGATNWRWICLISCPE